MADLSDSATAQEGLARLYGILSREELREKRGLDVYTTEFGEIIHYDPKGPRPVALPEIRPSAEWGRCLAKRVLERMKEFSGPGCHGLRWLKVGRNVWESIVELWASDCRFPDATKPLWFNGLPVKLDLGMEPDVVCYYG